MSVHGYWLQTSGPARIATIRTELWAKGPRDRSFRKVAEQTRRGVWPGGGAGKRATARMACKNNVRTEYYGKVDVDIEGYRDLPGMRRGDTMKLDCGL